MALSVTPYLSRKKLVPDKYSPDTFRVISLEAERQRPEFHQERLYYGHSFIDPPNEKLPKIHHRKSDPPIPLSSSDRHHRAHNPQPRRCGFLIENASTLNEPICNIFGDNDDSFRWWEHASQECSNSTKYAYDSTTQRRDYHYRNPAPSQFPCFNPDKEGAYGAVPVNFLPAKHGYPRLWKEGLSYEHMYNSRGDPNYPIRGKRHGAFIWDAIPHEKSKCYFDQERCKLENVSFFHSKQPDNHNGKSFQKTDSLQNCISAENNHAPTSTVLEEIKSSHTDAVEKCSDINTSTHEMNENDHVSNNNANAVKNGDSQICSYQGENFYSNPSMNASNVLKEENNHNVHSLSNIENTKKTHGRHGVRYSGSGRKNSSSSQQSLQVSQQNNANQSVLSDIEDVRDLPYA